MFAVTGWSAPEIFLHHASSHILASSLMQYHIHCRVFTAMSSQAHWSDDDITTLVTFLISKKASAGDGISFKGSVWTEAAMAINKVPPTKGAKKKLGSCQSKWGKVGYLLSSL